MNLFQESDYIIVHIPSNGKVLDCNCLFRTDSQEEAVRNLFQQVIESGKDGHFQVRRKLQGSTIGTIIKKVEVHNGMITDVA